MKKLILLLVLLPFCCFSQQYKIDSTFGTNGFSQNFFAFVPRTIFCDSNNAYYFTGTEPNQNLYSLASQKIKPDGNLDSTFSDDGNFSSFIHYNDVSNDLEVLFNQNKILVGETQDSLGNQYGWITRLKSNGQLDSSFNNGIHILFPDFPIKRIDIVLNQKILLYGTIDNKCALKRLNEDGSPDVSFANNGTMIINPLQNYYPGDMHGFPNGEVIIAGSNGTFDNIGMPITNFSYIIQKILPQGQIDSSFGTNGKFEFDIDTTSIEIVKRLHLTSDNYIVVSGWSNKKLLAIKLSLAGIQDMNFGMNGMLYDATMIGGLSAMNTDNQLIVGANVDTGGSLDVYIKRYLNGIIDLTLGSNGDLVFDLPNSMNYLADIRFDFANRLLFAFDTYSSPIYFRCTPFFSPTNTTQILPSERLHIYPNPFTDHLILENDFEVDIPISIINSAGNIVYKGFANKYKSKIQDFSQLAPGIYYIVIKNDISISYKLIKH